MKNSISEYLRPMIHKLGIDIVRYSNNSGCPPDLCEENKKMYDTVKQYTMTSPEKVSALVDAVCYIVANGIEGAIVECGVWKGGSMMAAALTLIKLGHLNRDLYLYDTYSGMSAPSDYDTSPVSGTIAKEAFPKTKIAEDISTWCLAPLEEVRKNLFSTGYPKEKIHFIKGMVEDTIPENAPAKIAILRLDTDWYESTKHELVHLFPLLQANGVLIIDDYGYWQGSRKAVDEYIAQKNINLLLTRIDGPGRIAVKIEQVREPA